MNDSIFVTQPSMPELDEYVREIEDIWRSKWLTNMGEKHKQFQSDLLEYLDVSKIELLTNGHMALELTLQAMNLQGEVITTPFTFASTTHAIVRNGLKPVFCDINADSFTINADKIEDLITDRTVAIVPVHVYGNICDVEKIEKIAHKYQLKVIYDAAHAFGECYKNIGIGNYGDASCFSFHATKVFNSIEGGAVTYKDDHVGSILYDLKNFGIHGKEMVSAVGANAKMNEFCAAMGICNLRHIDQEILKRKAIVERYRAHLADVPGLQLNIIQKNVKNNYSYFPIVVEPKMFGATREDIYDLLMKNGVYVRKYFYPLTNMFEAFHNQYNVMETPIALKVSKRVLTLPLYADLPFEEVDRISDLIISCRN